MTTYYEQLTRNLDLAWEAASEAPAELRSRILDAIEHVIDSYNDQPDLGPWEIRCLDMSTGRDAFDRTVYGPLCRNWQDRLSRAQDVLAQLLLEGGFSGPAEALHGTAEQARSAAERSTDILTPRAGDNFWPLLILAALLVSRR